MNTLFIVLLLISCALTVATFGCFASAMCDRCYRENGAYRLKMQYGFKMTIILLILTIGFGIGTFFAATRCPSCTKIAMHEYCTHCGTHVVENDRDCNNCGAEVDGDTYCGHCGAKQEGDT